MNRRQRTGAIAAAAGVVIAIVAAVVAPRFEKPPSPLPPPPPRVFPATEPPPHPFIPTEAREEQPKAFCEARDIFLVGVQVRGAQKKGLEAAKAASKEGAPAVCHTEAAAKELALALNGLIGRTGACVARDSPLDSQWNQLESAVAALDRCMECTHARNDRLIGCKRALELVDAAEKAAR